MAKMIPWTIEADIKLDRPFRMTGKMALLKFEAKCDSVTDAFEEAHLALDIAGIHAEAIRVYVTPEEKS